MGCGEIVTAAAPPILKTSPSKKFAKKYLLPLVPFLIVVGLWWAIWRVGDYPIGVLPSPGRVLNGFIENWEEFRVNIWASLKRLAMGFTVAAVTGIVVGIAAGLSKRFSEFLSPIVTFMNALSGIAWIPLAIAWFSVGTGMVVFIIWNAAFFLIFANVALGVSLVPVHLDNGLRTLGAKRLRIIWQVTIPGAMPYIMAGLRQGLGFGWRALIAAELVGATSGLGQYIFIQQEFSRADLIIAGALTIGLIGLSMDRLILAPLERRTIERWGLVGGGT